MSQLTNNFLFDAHRIYGNIWIGAWDDNIVDTFRRIVMCAPWRSGTEEPKMHIGEDSTGIFYAPFQDDFQPPGRNESETIEWAAKFVSDHAHSDLATLVVCREGKNRSGLVAARALMLLGSSSEEAIHTVRSSRPGALYNEFFCEYLRGTDKKQ